MPLGNINALVPIYTSGKLKCIINTVFFVYPSSFLFYSMDIKQEEVFILSGSPLDLYELIEFSVFSTLVTTQKLKNEPASKPVVERMHAILLTHVLYLLTENTYPSLC